MPVFPEVGSRIVWLGPISPFSSASSIIDRATRSLTEPVGLRDSSFAQIRTPGLGLRRLSSISGVWPIDWMMSPYRPPQGLFWRRSRAIASRSIATAWYAGAGATVLYGYVYVEVVVVLVVGIVV